MGSSAKSSPDNAPTLPITRGRVRAILEENGIGYKTADSIIRTGFPNSTIAMVVHDSHLLLDARWRARPPKEARARVVESVNNWNLTRVHPTLYWSETDEDFEIHAEATLPALEIAGGYTRNYLGMFIMLFLRGIYDAFDDLAQHFTELIDWDENTAEKTSPMESTTDAAAIDTKEKN